MSMATVVISSDADGRLMSYGIVLQGIVLTNAAVRLRSRADDPLAAGVGISRLRTMQSEPVTLAFAGTALEEGNHLAGNLRALQLVVSRRNQQ